MSIPRVGPAALRPLKPFEFEAPKPEVFEQPRGWRPRAAQPAQPQLPEKLDESFERAVLEGVRKPGKLVTLSEGDARKPLALTIHGINGNPEDVRTLIEDAKRAGETALTFCYDDQYRRLTQSAGELAEQLGAQLDENPRRPLEISAHSMGSRVALSALGQLNEQGKLTMPVELRLIAPPLGGFGSANGAALMPKFLGEHISGVQPGMGTASDFQHELEALRLPANVKVTVFTGGRDDIVDPSLEGFGRIVENLRAKHVVLPEADHVGAVEAAAQWLRESTTR
jgi:hypothetical protein